MRNIRLIALALVLSACARTATTTAPVSTPAPPPSTPPATTPAPSLVPATALREAPANWHLLDLVSDGVAGISAERAMRELLANRQPQRTVVVAVIDGGVDTAHADLRDNLWKHPDEVAGNGTDDDKNGYVDDVRGWNFIGGANGRSVEHDTYEVTRLFAVCAGGTSPRNPIPRPSTAECQRVRQDFERRRNESTMMLGQVRPIAEALNRSEEILEKAIGTDSLTEQRVSAFEPRNQDEQRAKAIWSQLVSQGATPKLIGEMIKHLEAETKYMLDTSFNPRPVVGDNYASVSERHYGNNDVMGPDASHGTHVAGIIGAVRGNGIGIDGVAPRVQIMSVRTVPNGDERDKDVANAIRYAVDNGANIINMSFGKGYSPHKQAVDEAVKYAESKGVLMVHAAGNDSKDNGTEPSFPTPVYDGGARAQLWIEVGATSWKGGDSLVAVFSNYNRDLVDVFAPGVDILSAAPGSKYERQSGTSMAAPVVSGIAAVLMSYYPQLTAADVKRIIVQSAARFGSQKVARPGDGSMVSFGSLSSTGGIVNLYNAVKMAEGMVVKQ